MKFIFIARIVIVMKLLVGIRLCTQPYHSGRDAILVPTCLGKQNFISSISYTKDDK